MEPKQPVLIRISIPASSPVNQLSSNGLDGAGRGNRTPMELLPTDFESPFPLSIFPEIRQFSGILTISLV